jgi:hypothetical protein
MPTKLVPTLADIGCRVVSATNPHGRNLGFLYRIKIKSVRPIKAVSDIRFTFNYVTLEMKSTAGR